MGSLQQICLRWNNHLMNFPKVFDSLLQNGDLVDVTLSCEGQKLKAHKVVLSACSPYFHNLFQENPCKHPVIVFRDIKFSELQSIIEFIYKGEVNVPRDELTDFIRTAQTLQVKGIAEESGAAGSEERSDAYNQRVKSSPIPVKKKSPPPLMPARKPSPSLSHSNNVQLHPSKKPRLKEHTFGPSFRMSPSSMFRETSTSSVRESSGSSPFRDSVANISFRETVSSISKENSISSSNHIVPPETSTVHSNSSDNEAPMSPAHIIPVSSVNIEPSSHVKLEMPFDGKDDSDSQPREGGIENLMESTMETGDEQYIVGESAPRSPDDEYSHDQSDEGSLAQFEDALGGIGGPSTSQSFSEVNSSSGKQVPKSESVITLDDDEELWNYESEQTNTQLHKSETVQFQRFKTPSNPQPRAGRGRANISGGISSVGGGGAEDASSNLNVLQQAIYDVLHFGFSVNSTAKRYGLARETLRLRVIKMKRQISEGSGT